MISVDEFDIVPTIFPDRTSQVWKLDDDIFNRKNVDITWDFEDESEFIHLAQLKMLLDSKNINSYLHISFLPYARQDKDVDNKSTFALHTFIKLLNNLEFNVVFVLDPHSDVSNTIYNFLPTYPRNSVEHVWKETHSNLAVYPDIGAKKKYSNIYKLPSSYAEKQRDQSTGKITSYFLHDGDYKDKTVLIVDDICDGGATFVLLAKELFKNKAKEVNLFVTHGLFTKGLKPLKEAGINRIFTHKGEVFEEDNNIQYEYFRFRSDI